MRKILQFKSVVNKVEFTAQRLIVRYADILLMYKEMWNGKNTIDGHVLTTIDDTIT